MGRLLCISRHTVLLPPFAPRCIFAPYVCPTCTRHLNTRAYSPAQSRPPPLLCVNCIIFTPNTFRPHAPRHGPPGSTGQIAHVHRKSPPVSQRIPLFYPSTPRSALSSTWVFPFFQKSRIFVLSLAPRRSSKFENHAKSRSWQLLRCNFLSKRRVGIKCEKILIEIEDG